MRAPLVIVFVAVISLPLCLNIAGPRRRRDAEGENRELVTFVGTNVRPWFDDTISACDRPWSS